jgi:succinoglycan biosynthesis protein ExoL
LSSNEKAIADTDLAATGTAAGQPPRMHASALPTVEGAKGAIRTISFFAHDSRESVVIKRAKAFQSTGASVIGFMFHRERDKDQPEPVWENVPLGATVDRNYLARLPKLCSGLWKALRHRRALAASDVIYARNFDMMVLATLAKWLSRSPAKLAYEVLDVQRAFVGDGPLRALFRWCERRLLSACDLLVVSSPMFMTHYFIARQGYKGPWFLLENKVSAAQFAAIPKAKATTSREPTAAPPWVIGWFGTLRCVRSLDILSRLAAAHPDKVTIHIRGTPSEEDIPMATLLAATAGKTNIQYFGPYESPKDLSEIYDQIHFTWAIDFLDAGSNSDWLLPNRLYEGGLFNAISIARAGTATGTKVERDGLGVTLDEPLDESLKGWLLDMTAEQYEALSAAARRAPRALFVDEEDTATLLGLLTKGAPQPNITSQAGAPISRN